ncbi:MAG: ABC transporter ATP-binding protein [Ruminococcus sp.]|nr:ABC transporter ATP-binding protein [Ruminococcus sp.]
MSLTAEGLTKEFIRETKNTNRFTAVDNVSLTLDSGELTVLMGRSGSGKTTLLNMLSGLLEPSSGRVSYDGRSLYEMSDKQLSRLRNKHFGVIPQGQTAIHSLSVMENIMLPFALYGEGGAEDESYARELMERLDILQLEGAKPAELSGGELRRMAIARAVIRKPPVIFADEPTGDLDDENTIAVFDFLKALAGEGAAVLVVTHENDAKPYADKLLTMSSGRLNECE